MGLLKVIKAKRIQWVAEGSAQKKLMKVGVKGSQELKNLFSSINYESGSAK